MIKLSIVVNKHNKKDGGVFYKAVAKGRYLPLVEVENDSYYVLKLHTPKNEKGVSEPLKTPEKAGFYDVAVPSKQDIWLDQRKEMAGKNIVHIRVSKIVFVEPLATRNIEK